MVREREVGIRCLQAKDCRGLPGAREAGERPGTDVLRASRRDQPANTLISHFRPPGL